VICSCCNNGRVESLTYNTAAVKPKSPPPEFSTTQPPIFHPMWPQAFNWFALLRWFHFHFAPACCCCWKAHKKHKRVNKVNLIYFEYKLHFFTTASRSSSASPLEESQSQSTFAVRENSAKKKLRESGEKQSAAWRQQQSSSHCDLAEHFS